MEEYERSHFEGKDGRRYDLLIFNRDPVTFGVRVYHREQFVGRVGGVVHPDGRMLLGDVVIKEAIVPPPPHLLAWAWRREVPAKPVNHRGNGLGSHLLLRLLREARARGVREVYGNVTPGDLRATPGLLDWYARHGFLVDHGSRSDLLGSLVIRRPLEP